MKITGFLYLLVLSLTSLSSADCIFEWLFGSDVGESNEKSKALVSSGGAFEIDTVDENFLVQAKDLSTLDKCNHVVVNYMKQTSCSKLSEEELGKLAVQLLNCQSNVEGRSTFKCTKEMTIRECTQAMDPTTWNAYQIVSNRARAVCYSVRQHQFRMRTEFTVNKLLSTTEGQLKNLKHLQEGQEKLGEVTSDTLRRVFDGQQELLSQQHTMREAQHNVHAHIAGNLQDLSREKALIAAGNKELAELTEQIKTKLDMTSRQIITQKFYQKQNHEEILSDLAAIRIKAQDVWGKIDTSSALILRYHQEAVEHYKTSLENLKLVNDTVNYIMNRVNNLSEALDKRFGWLGRMIGTTGDRLNLVSTCVVHVLYFLLAAVCAAFLHIPTASRAVLLLVVPLNAMSEVHHGRSLTLYSLTIFIMLVTLAYYVASWLYRLLVGSVAIETSHTLPCPSCHSPRQRILPSSDGTGSDPNSSFGKPDMEKLSSILEKLQKSANRIVAPQARDPSEKRNTPQNVLDRSLVHTTSRWDVGGDTPPLSCPPTPNDCPPTPMPETRSMMGDLSDLKLDVSFSTTQLYPAPTLNTAKRHLLQSLESFPGGRQRRSHSRSSTPIRDIRGSPYSSRSGSPNTSLRRPLCNAFTKSGVPCKLYCVDGKQYCHRHIAPPSETK